tara:strand:- start:2031 stop:3278 length:1248 start_codon:yes stop_codon:yes gene_type:complete
MFILYRILSYLFLIFSPLIIIYRIIKKKESISRFLERYSFQSVTRKKGKLIWLHCASVGEFLSIIPLIEKFEKNSKVHQILITTTTLSSSKIFNRMKFKKTVHQFFPIDNKLVMSKFINYWKPSIFFLCESELWPNLIDTIKEKKIKLILLNGRMTYRSYNRWKKIKFFANEILNKFDLFFAQNIETQKRLKKLGAKKIIYLGNLKFSTSEKIKHEVVDKRVENFFRNKKILMTAASTHFNEENFVIQNHLYFLKKNIKNLASIIIPRHVERANEIKDLLRNYSLKSHFHSDKAKINKDVDIYIVDTYGEVNKFYRMSKIVFMGGSLINHGGQNPLEPAKFGCEIIYGPFINNFKEIYKKLDDLKISKKFSSYNSGINIIKKKFNKKNRVFDNRMITKYGETILNSTYNRIQKLI